MKRTIRRPTLRELCRSARTVLEDQLLTTQIDDVTEQARRRRLDDLFTELKQQIETLADPSVSTLTER
jgi:hypothetical protein